MTRVRTLLLICGMVSSLLYLATDVVGGMRYDGYSFTSQAVSELMARGAPSEDFVDPLFIIYDVLVLAFAVGVFREGAARGRGLRITGALLVGYAAIGLTGPTLFEMHQRGAGGGPNDASHIVLTGVLVLLLLLSIGIGGLSLGRRFWIFSFAVLVIVIAFGALTVPYAARLAAGQSTPGLGILERINIYSSMLWVAVLGIALLRQRSATKQGSLTPIGGHATNDFEHATPQSPREYRTAPISPARIAPTHTPSLGANDSPPDGVPLHGRLS